MTQWLYVAVAALLGTLAGVLLGRTTLGEGAKDALAAGGGLAIAGTILLTRALVYFASGGGESASFVGLDLPARPLMLVLVAVATAVALVGAHFLLTRSGAVPASWVQRGRPAIVGTIASSVAAWLTCRDTGSHVECPPLSAGTGHLINAADEARQDGASPLICVLDGLQ